VSNNNRKSQKTGMTGRKIEQAARLIRQHSRMFMCPLCSASMTMNESNSLICSNRHCFDLSKRGYIHLLSRTAKPTKYDKEVFEARQAICRSGFFDEVIEQVRDIVRRETGDTRANPIHILDVGCGEGSHLAGLVTSLGIKTEREVVGVGMDISKDGIHLASREYPGLIWCVADLAQSPFADKQFDVILNIFTPSNYAEFTRVLRDDGILIKIVPGTGYLRELRAAFYGQTDRQTYSNDHVVRHFRSHFHPVETLRIHYDKRLDQTNLKHLIHMTPLSWGTTEENLEKALHSGVSHVTVDVTVMVGRKK
jgi:23S rRNA (guanine745-N1)-methyltransferase